MEDWDFVPYSKRNIIYSKSAHIHCFTIKLLGKYKSLESGIIYKIQNVLNEFRLINFHNNLL